MLDRIRQRMRRLCRLGDPTRVLYSKDGRQQEETTDLQRIKSSQGVKGNPGDWTTTPVLQGRSLRDHRGTETRLRRLPVLRLLSPLEKECR